MTEERSTLTKGYDIDGVLAHFVESAIERANVLGLGQHFPKTPKEWDTYNPVTSKKAWRALWNSIGQDVGFWSNIPVIDGIDPKKVDADIYVTSRGIPTWVTQKWLFDNGFREAPVVTVRPRKIDGVWTTTSKIPTMLEFGIHIFLDDKHETFMEINYNCPTVCYLMDRPTNKREEDGIYSHLRLDDINEFNAFQ